MAKFDQYMKGELKFSSPALTFGTLYDVLLFERDKAMDTYTILHTMIMDRCTDKTRASKRPKLTNDYKAVRAQLEQEAANDDGMLCTPEDWKMQTR